MQLTYDAADHYLLMLGATGGPGTLNGTQTWAFGNGTWRQLGPASSPESCLGSVLAYDEFDGYVVYFAAANFGGVGTCSSAGQTWIYRGGDWTQLTPTVSPPPRQSAAFTNDSRDGYMLLFGGACNMGVPPTLCGDTWEFLGGAWTNLTNSVHPSPRAGAGMTYDASDGYVLLFGGTAWPVNVAWPLMVTDTWEYHAGVWIQIGSCGGPSQPSCGASAPPEPFDDGLAYDSTDGVVLYTCADDNVSSADPEIYWTYNAGNWTDLNNWSLRNANWLPSNRLAEGLAYDWGDGYAVLFGGISTTWQLLNDTWSFQSDSWTNITGGAPNGLTSSITATPTSGIVPLAVAFTSHVSGGIGPYTHSWNFGDGNTSTGPMVSHTFTTRGIFRVTLNVSDSQGSWSETAISIFAKSTQTTPISVSMWRTPTSGTVPLEVNLTAYGSGCENLCQITFFIRNAYGSSNVGPNPGPSVPNRTNVTALADVTSVGSWVATALVQDQLGDKGSANVTIDASAGPGGLTIIANASPSTGSAPLDVTFSGNVTRGIPPYAATWTFGDGGNGTGLQLTHTYFAPGTFQATLRVIDALSRTASESINIVVSSGASHSGSLSVSFGASPNHGPAPLNVTLNVSAIGGFPPYHLTVCAMPNVCSLNEGDWSGAAQLFVTGYDQPGNYTASATVTDSAANQTIATTLVSIAPSATLYVSASVSAESGSSPLTVSFTAVLQGGNRPFSIQWIFGDGSFGTSFDRTKISHTYADPGTYSPILSVTDSGGRRVNQSLPPVSVSPGTGVAPGIFPVVPSQYLGGSRAHVAIAVVVSIVLGYLGLSLSSRRRLRLEGERIVQALEDSKIT